MAFRNIYICNSAKLNIKNEQLVINTDAEYTVPLEDITTIVIENLQSTLTTYMLYKLSQHNIALIVCDERHLPVGILQPYSQHSRQLSVIHKQIQASKPLKNRLWQQVVQQKIQNQGICLELMGKCKQADYLYALANDVTSGDKGNKESIAASFYFKNLYGKGFNRDQENVINGALNYGYAILRGAVARAVASYGLQPSLGIFHHSELNAFNLVDDFLEPLRPLVDLWVIQNKEILEEELTTENKQCLVSLLGHDMLIDHAKHTIHNVADKMIKSYVSALQQTTPYYSLLLPKLIRLQEHMYE